MALITIFYVLSGCRRTSNVSSMFSVPDGVTYENKVPEFHSFHWNDGNDTALFMISPHPAGLSESMVSWMADQTANQFEPVIKDINGVESFIKKSSDISAGKFTGRLIDFLLKTKDGKTFRQCIYVLWDGERVWQGQLTGPKDSDIEMVHRILESRKK